MAKALSELKGTKTAENLQEAFAGESMANTKYTFYGSKAKKEGYNQIGELFLETAHNEREHAKQWFKFLHDGDVPTTTVNLQDAADGEHYEWTDMYANMAATAREEGFTQVAAKMELVLAIERRHEERYLQLLNNINEGLVFSRDEDTIWKCMECGHIVIGKNPPEVCPVCAHAKAYFEIDARNY